jgi:hypothetical protein
MELDINALSRPYDPSVDDEMPEMPVQGFVQGGDVGGIGYEKVDPTPGAEILGAKNNPNLVGGASGRTDPEKYFDPAAAATRQEESDKYFQNSSNNRLSNSAYINNTQSSYNPYVATMPIDPATGLPKSPQSYTVYETLAPGQTGPASINQKATSEKLLADYTKAVNAVPMSFAFDPNEARSYKAPQMPTTADFIARRDKAGAGVPIMGQYKDPIMYSREANPNYMQFKSNPYAPITTMPIENPNNGGGTVDIQVVVYGPDGKMYSSPAAARAAGVTNYTSIPPGSTVKGSGAGSKVGGYVNGGMVQHFAEGGSAWAVDSQGRLVSPDWQKYGDANLTYSFDPSLFKDRYGEVRSSDDFAEQLQGLGDLPPNQRKAAVNTYMYHLTGNEGYLNKKNAGYEYGPTAFGTNPWTEATYNPGISTADISNPTTNPATNTKTNPTTTSPIVGSKDIADVIGNKTPGTTGTGVSVAPGTNIPFQTLPGSGQTTTAKADLTSFNPSYEINKNLNPSIGQLPPGFSFDPNKYFTPSQAQTKIAANPNLTPTAVGLYTQDTDRLGNVIAMPTIDPLKFQSFYTTPITRASGGMVQHFADGGGVEGTQPVRRNQVPEQFQNATYDDASRKQALDTLRTYNQSVNGVTDAEIAAQMYGLNQLISQDPNYVRERNDPIPVTYLSKYDNASRAEAQAALIAKGLNAAGLSDLELAQATASAYPEGYGVIDQKTGQYIRTFGGGATGGGATGGGATGGGATGGGAPPIVGSPDIAPVVGTKPPGTTGTGVSVAPGTNIPFQPLPNTGQTTTAKTDLTSFNPSYEINKNLNPGIGQLPQGFSFDPNKYFSPSQAQTKIAANPNLTPTPLGTYTQDTDRLGNVIATPTIDPLKFQSFYTTPVTRAAGGLVEDDEDTEASGAKQMLKGYEQLTGPRETRVTKSPNAQSVRSRQVSQVVDKQGRPAGMGMTYESMTTAQGPSQASPEQLATAKAMLSDLMRQNLTKRRFAEGGEASNFTSGASAKAGAPEDKLTFGDKYLVEPALDVYQFFKDRGSLPSNKQIFLDSVRGGDRSQITEKNFNSSELEKMDEMVRGRYKGLEDPLTKYGQHLEEVLKGKLPKKDKAQYASDLEMIKKFQAGQFTPGLMALAEGEEPSKERRRGLVMSGAAGELAKLGKIRPEVKYSDYPKKSVEESRSLSGGKTPTESLATSLGQFRYGLGPEGNFVIKDKYDFNPRVGSEELDAVPAVVSEGLYGRLREYAGRKMPPGQGRDVLVNLPKRADGSPKKGETAPAPRRTDLEKLKDESKQYSQYNDLMDFLASRLAVPEISQTYLGPSTGGEFTSGWGAPKNGKIEVNWGATPSTLVHELTHAADRQISHQASDLEERHRKETPIFDYIRGKTVLTPEEVRLAMGYRKLHYNPNKDYGDPARYPRQQLINKMAPEWSKKNYDYRSGDGELVAYGMGSTVPRRGYRAPLHVDPTMATEFSILLDLAQRAQKAKPPSKE